MVSVSAWYLLRKKHVELAMANMKLALPAFILFVCANFFVFGPQQAIEVTNNQGLKLASMEGLWQSTSCAPLFLVGWVDTATQTTSGISVPCLLSVLAYLNPQAVVVGGDMAAAFDIVAGGIRESVYTHGTALATRDLQFLPSTFGDRAGVVGCAAMALDHVLSPAAVDARLVEVR